MMFQDEANPYWFCDPSEAFLKLLPGSNIHLTLQFLLLFVVFKPSAEVIPGKISVPTRNT